MIQYVLMCVAFASGLWSAAHFIVDQFARGYAMGMLSLALAAVVVMVCHKLWGTYVEQKARGGKRGRAGGGLPRPGVAGRAAGRRGPRVAGSDGAVRKEVKKPKITPPPPLAGPAG